MARSKSQLVIVSEYALVRFLVAVLRRLPRAWAACILRALIHTVLFFMPKRRQLMLDNIARSFPEYPPARHQQIARESITNLARGTAVFMRMPDIFAKEDLDWVDVEGLEYLEEGLKRGKGVLTFTGHYGCWELMAALTMHRYPHVSAVYRALDNPRIDAFVKAHRCSGGGLMIERKDILRQALKWVKENGVMGFLIDQNFAAGGVFVDFFGRPAATTPLLSILARRTGATLLSTHNRWEGNRLRIIWSQVPMSTNPDNEKAIAEDTQLMTKMIEGWIRKDPGQWMWLHNRWKRQPLPGEKIFQG